MIQIHKYPSIRVTQRVKLKDPVVVAAWPGMGDVAFKAALYLKEKLNAQEFATMLPQDYFAPSSVAIQSSLVSLPQYPVGKFFYARHPDAKRRDLIIFLSDAQPFLEKGYRYACEIVAFAQSLKAKIFYTFAAMPLPIEHTQMPDVHVAASHQDVLDLFIKKGHKTMPAGQITGMNGLVLGVAKEQGLQGVCLLGEIPIYTIQLENPLASMVVLSVLAQELDWQLDLGPLKEHAEQIGQEIEQMIEFLKNPQAAPQEENPIEQSEIDTWKHDLNRVESLPDSVRQRIEELFHLARKDLSKVMELKKELDKWNVYDRYEDSFLDLFKKPPKKEH